LVGDAFETGLGAGDGVTICQQTDEIMVASLSAIPRLVDIEQPHHRTHHVTLGRDTFESVGS
jgi:hypothetical protein